MAALNYKHLHYFWVVAKTGGIARAGERLHLTAQTISGQITLFEDSLGYKLFNRIGRKLELNDVGRTVFAYADQIFTLGQELEEVMRFRPGGSPLQFRVGVADAVPKTIAYLLLETALTLDDPVRIVCREGKLNSLLGDLAIHRLDIVIADSPMPANIDVRGYSHLLGECSTSIFATPSAVAAQLKQQLGVVQIGQTEQVTEQFYAISVERRLTHPAVLAIQSAARESLIIPQGK